MGGTDRICSSYPNILHGMNQTENCLDNGQKYAVYFLYSGSAHFISWNIQCHTLNHNGSQVGVEICKEITFVTVTNKSSFQVLVHEFQQSSSQASSLSSPTSQKQSFGDYLSSEGFPCHGSLFCLRGYYCPEAMVPRV